MSESSNSADRYVLAVITDEGGFYLDVRRHMGSEFRTILSSTEDEIKKNLEEPELHAVLFDLDCIEGSPADGLEVLEEMRRVRGMLMRHLTIAKQSGGDIRLLKPTKFTVQTLKMVGLLNLFSTYDDLGQAFDSLR